MSVDKNPDKNQADETVQLGPVPSLHEIMETMDNTRPAHKDKTVEADQTLDGTDVGNKTQTNADATIQFTNNEPKTQMGGFDTPVNATVANKPTPPPKSKDGKKQPLPKEIGNYEIMSVLGRGGMGIVYKARHRKLGREVALKMVLAGSHASEEQLERFIAEAKAVAHMQHPNIVQIFEVGEHEGLPFFSLEYVDGDSLDKQVRQQPLDPQYAAKLTETLSRAIQYAHDHKVLHRDIKPANVLMSSEGVPKVTDFGLAKRLEDADDAGSTRTGTIMGTPAYMSPEQARGDVHALGPATDQYSLGAMLYEFLTGRPPFMAAKAVDTILQVLKNEPIPPRQLQPKLPIDLETICLKALQKDPTQRYADCTAMANDLQHFMRGEPISARPVGRAERAWRWCRRNPLVASLSAVALLGLFAVAVISSISAWMVSSKNEELVSLNGKLKTTIDDLAVSNRIKEEQKAELADTNKALESTILDLGESNKEKQRRSERLQSFVQDSFIELVKIDVKQNPRMKNYRDQSLAKTLPIVDEIINELGEEGQGAPTKMALLRLLAMTYRDQGRGADAERIFLSLIELARKRVKLMDGSDASRSNLVIFLSDLASIRLEMNRNMAASLEVLDEALVIAEDLVKNPKAAPSGQGLLHDYEKISRLADVHHSIGTNYYRVGNSATALPYFEKSYELKTKLLPSLLDGTAFENPPPTTKPLSEDNKKVFTFEFVDALTRTRLALAGVYYRVGFPDRAETLYRELTDNAEKALASDRTNLSLIRMVMGFNGIWAEFLAQTGRVDDARPIFKRLAELGDELITANSESAEYQYAVATAYYRFAQWFADIDREKSQTYGQKALDIRKQMVAVEPNDDRRQIELLLPLGRYGDIEVAKAIAEKYFTSSNPDSEMLFTIAQSLSQASARESDEIASQSRKKAIEALQKSVSLGHTDFVTIENEIDFKPLQSMAEFTKLVNELKAQAASKVDSSDTAKLPLNN
jgi:eukaryotic-like serine/threonine-protein kinase